MADDIRSRMTAPHAPTLEERLRQINPGFDSCLSGHKLALEAADRINKLESALGIGDICLVCGISKDARDKCNAKEACTFDPTPRQLFDACVRLRAENEALLQDKARIDWLELIIRDGSCASFINDMVFATQKVGAIWGYPSLRTIMDGLREQATAAASGEGK